MIIQKCQAVPTGDIQNAQPWRPNTIYNAQQRKCKQLQCGNISLGHSVYIQYICMYTGIPRNYVTLGSRLMP
jgi:hypothetical protein